MNIYMKYNWSCLQLQARNLLFIYHSLFSSHFGALYPSLSSYHNYHPCVAQEESAPCRYHVQTCISSQQIQVHLLIFGQLPTASALQSSLQAVQEQGAFHSQKRKKEKVGNLLTVSSLFFFNFISNYFESQIDQFDNFNYHKELTTSSWIFTYVSLHN